MRSPSTIRRGPRPSEEGYILVAVMFLLAVFILALSVAVPRIKASIQVDRERETMQRGKQYARAIKLYYKKFNAYPPSLDALVMTSNVRFLRKRYTDPMTGKDDWRPIRFGENKTPIALGFFGQPMALSGATLAGTGVSGGNTSSITGASSLLGGSSSLTGSTSTTSGTDASGTASSTSSTGSAFGSTTSGTNSTSGTSSSSGQTFGGGGIIGFAPGSTAKSILLYKKKDHFNEWEFLYSPAQDAKTITSGSATTVGSSSGSSSLTGSTSLSSGSSSTTSTGSTSSGSSSTTP